MNKKGFTLIELLVVIAIIGLLSSVVLASLKNAREKAQITKFKQEMQSVKNALELYRSTSGSYPSETDTDLETIRVNYLSSYIKSRISIPAAMYPNDPIIYYDGSQYSCGSLNEVYTVTFESLNSNVQSQFYTLYNNSPTLLTVYDPASWKCAFLPPK